MKPLQKKGEMAMSYKSVWFEKAHIEKIADSFDCIKAEDLLDRDGSGECLEGGYGANILDKLRRHPLAATAEIKAIVECEYEQIKALRIERLPYQRDEKAGLWRCRCGWTGEGTGHNGALLEGDRCPDCSVHL